VHTPAAEVEAGIRSQTTRSIGKIARPHRLLLCPGLPKTRSGKSMRRILRKIAGGEYHDLGDVTTLADPGVVEKIIATHQAANKK